MVNLSAQILVNLSEQIWTLGSVEYGAGKRPILEQAEEHGILPYPPMQQFQLLG